MENFQPTTSFIGHNLIHLPRVDSTNTFLKEYSRDQQLSEGTVVFADDQFRGRGRHDHVWNGDAGLNVYCSVFLTPVFLSPVEAPFLNFAVSLAVADTVSSFIPHSQVRVKWPNDIIVDGLKISGILIENSIARSRMDSSVVGIGINVNQQYFPEKIHATSVLQQTGQFVRITEVLKELCQNLERRYLSLKGRKGHELWAQYNDRLFAKGENIRFVRGDEELSGGLVRVAQDGNLEMKVNGKLVKFSQGEIKLEWYELGSRHR